MSGNPADTRRDHKMRSILASTFAVLLSASVVLPANGSRIVSEKDVAVIAIVTRHAQGCERVGQSNFRV